VASGESEKAIVSDVCAADVKNIESFHKATATEFIETVVTDLSRIKVNFLKVFNSGMLCEIQQSFIINRGSADIKTGQFGAEHTIAEILDSSGSDLTEGNIENAETQKRIILAEKLETSIGNLIGSSAEI